MFNKFIFISYYFLSIIGYVFFTYQTLINFGYSHTKVQFRKIIGPSTRIKSEWVGLQKVDQYLPILVFAGHADSQGFSGAGTRGEAVSIKGLKPMNPLISDELFWNLKIRDEVVRIGKIRGLNINSYEPFVRNISDENDPRTNWSKGFLHAKKGGYSVEIHFDSYGKYGSGSGLIPPLFTKINTVDESIARTFGRFPLRFRGGLGAPKRQIRILEIGKLEGLLEKNLRDLTTRQKTITLISGKIVHSIMKGITQKTFFNPTLGKDDIYLPAIYL